MPSSHACRCASSRPPDFFFLNCFLTKTWRQSTSGGVEKERNSHRLGGKGAEAYLANCSEISLRPLIPYPLRTRTLLRTAALEDRVPYGSGRTCCCSAPWSCRF